MSTLQLVIPGDGMDLISLNLDNKLHFECVKKYQPLQMSNLLLIFKFIAIAMLPASKQDLIKAGYSLKLYKFKRQEIYD